MYFRLLLHRHQVTNSYETKTSWRQPQCLLLPSGSGIRSVENITMSWRAGRDHCILPCCCASSSLLRNLQKKKMLQRHGWAYFIFYFTLKSIKNTRLHKLGAIFKLILNEVSILAIRDPSPSTEMVRKKRLNNTYSYI